LVVGSETGGNQLERELNYYRRECNDLGSRLLRLQEEQSRTFREARRSRTVVKLLREAYRLGDVTPEGGDIGGPMLEIVVENALCDRAALLREEPIGSGQFLLVNAIGLSGGASDHALTIPAPQAFLYTTAREPDPPGAADLVALLGLPFVLWAYDRPSGHALLLGNRSQTNVNRPFEDGDQELIESALSVYLDVLYRKQAEAALRQAKQAAEANDDNRLKFLRLLAEELSAPLQSINDLAGVLAETAWQIAPRDLSSRAAEIGTMSSYVHMLLDEASQFLTAERQAPSLEVGWVAAEEVVRAAMRAVYARAVRSGVELVARMPKRRISICVDRVWMQHVLQHLISSAVRLTSEGSPVRVETGRRGDGSIEVLISSGSSRILTREERPLLDPDNAGDNWAAGGDLAITRRLIEAHAGTLTIERSAEGTARARLILPARITRDDDLSDADG
jgi:signal transduction histidine kinase